MSRLFRRCAQALSVGMVLASSAFAGTNPKILVRPQSRVVGKVDNKQLTVLHNTVPAVVGTAADNGRLAPSTPFNHMLLVLKSSDEQEHALQGLLDQQQDKSSANYHQWLTPETFGASFGVANSDITTVTNWLQDQGFAVEQVSTGGRVIKFSGTSGQVESAFHTEIHNITVNGEKHVANTVDLSVPQALSPVIAGISKLNNFARTANAVNPHPVVKGTDGEFHAVVPGTSEPDYTSNSSGSHYVGPGDLATIYNGKPLLGTGIDGTGVTIGIIGQSAINLSNVETYRSMFRLPDNDPQIINVGPPPAVIGDDIESDLDVELAGALATGAKVKFYTAGVGGFYDVGIDVSALEAVDSNVADIISLSYGGCEKNDGAASTAYFNTMWEQAAAQGQTVFVSTGDSSATTCASSSATLATGASAVYAVNALGSGAYNVAVGGTGFFEDLSTAEAVKTGVTKYWGPGGVAPYGTALSYIPETAYSEGAFDVVQQGTGIAGGGGGVSIFTARPVWQVAPGVPAADPAGPTFTTTGAIPAGTPHRLVPDVSFIATGGHDGTIFCSEGVCKLDSSGNVTGIGVVGGTSVATPAMAGVQALINQKNGGRQGNANYYYYKLATAQSTANCTSTSATSGVGCNFNDVVTGDNYSPLTANGKYNVSTGTISGTKGTDYIGFAAGTGYDLATGLGSPNITNLANNWKSVTFNATTTKLTLSPTTTTHGTAMAATVAVAATSGTGTPSGDVSIIAVGQTPGGTGDGNLYTLSAGSVSATLTSLPGGTYNVVAHYTGDSVYGASDSAPVSVTIAKENSTTFLTPGQATSGGSLSQLTSYPYGLSVYLETEVQGNSATSVNGNDVLNTGVPTGSVTYALSTGATTLTPATANLDVYGTTYLEIGPSYSGYLLNANYPVLPPAVYSATASYPGDNSFNASSASANFTIVKATSVPTLRTGTAEIASGATALFNVTLAASGAGVLPTGTVTLTDTTTSTTVGTGTLVNGAVVISTTAIITSGAHSVTATYSGDANYNTSTSTATTLTVGGTASSVTLSVTVGGVAATTAPVLTAVTLTATLPASATGTVYFYDGALALGSAAISTTTHLATLSIATLTAATHNLTATYAGNTTLSSSTSAAVPFITTQNKPTLSLTSQQATNSTTTLSMNAVLALSPANNGAAVPAPSVPVQFLDGTTVLGTANLVYTANYHTYAAAFTTTALLSVGTHTLTAQFPGDTNYAAATSGTQSVTIAKTATSTTLKTSATNVGTGTYFTLTANVTAVQPINPAPAPPALGGTVTFYDGATVIGTATVTGGVATLTTAALNGVGTHTVTAVYSGDTNYATSTSTNTVTITAGTPGFSLSASPSSITVVRGSTASTTITAVSFGNYNASVAFSCSGLPAGSFCSFSPGGVAFAGGNTTAASVLTVGALAPAAKSAKFAGLLWLPALMLAGLFTIRRKQFSARGRQLLMLALLACGMMAVSGCGSGGVTGTPTGTSSVLVTGTAIGAGPGSGNVTQTTAISVTVQ